MSQILKHTSAHSLLSVVINSLVHKGALLYGGKPRMCVLWNINSPDTRMSGLFSVTAFRSRGLHPLAPLCGYRLRTCHLETVLANHSQTTSLKKNTVHRPSAVFEQQAVFFYLSIKIKEVNHYGKTENHGSVKSYAQI